MQVLLDLSNNNGHLVFLTKDKPMMCPYPKKQVPQSWNTSNGISQKVLGQGGADLLKYADNSVGVYTAYVLAYWHTGILAYWRTGILAYWRTGILAYWRTDILMYWRTGVLVY